MSLPIQSVPTYDVKLVSLPKPVTFRPYLVKEEKLLLMAQQSDDPSDIERAVKQIITNCTNGAVNVDTLASFDLEYLFIQLRAKSVNNVIEIRYECQAPSGTTDGICHATVPVTVNLDDVRVAVPEGHTNRFMLTQDIGVTLRYPTANHYDALVKGTSDITTILVDCLETVFTSGGEVTEISEQTHEDVVAFIDGMQIPQLDMLRAFFQTLPTLTHTVQFKCSKCGYTEDITLSGLADFFD